MVLHAETVRLQQAVKFMELPQVVGNHGAGTQNTLVRLEELAGWQATQEVGQLLNVTLLLQCLAHALNLQENESVES